MLPSRLFRWSLALLLAPLLALPSAVAEESPRSSEPLLRVEGTLEDSDPTLSEDNTRYDEYRFEGQAGQTITIVLESVEFDPYVLLKNPAGETIEQNDDYAEGNKNSAITITLSEIGTYTLVANAYRAESRGQYRLTVLAGSEPVFLLANEQVELLEERLAEYREAGDREGEAGTLYELGLVYYKLEQYPQAIEAFREALISAKTLNKSEDQVGLYALIGYSYLFQSTYARKQQNYEEAYGLAEAGLTAFQASLDVAQSISNQALEQHALRNNGQVYGNLSLIVFFQGNYVKALELSLKSIEFLEKSLSISRRINDDENIQITTDAVFSEYLSVINIAKSLEKLDLAFEYISKVQSLAVELQDPEKMQIVKQFELSFYTSLGTELYNDPTRYGELLEIDQKIIDLARTLNQPGVEIQSLLRTAQIHRFQGQYAESLNIYQKALIRAEEVSSPTLTIQALQGIGLIHDSQANYREALMAYEQALKIAQVHNRRIFQTVSLTNIARIYSVQGQYSQALNQLREALAIEQTTYDQYSGEFTFQTFQLACAESNAISDFLINQNSSDSNEQPNPENYSEICSHLDQIPTGDMLNHFKSISSTFATGARSRMSGILHIIGGIYNDQGNYPEALEIYQHSLNIARDLEESDREANVLNSIATVYVRQGNYTQALELVQRAFDISAAQGSSNQITYRMNLGSIRSSLGNYADALVNYEQALTEARQLGERSTEASILYSIGSVYNDQGNYATALQKAEQALKIEQEIGSPLDIALSLDAFGAIYRRLGQFEQALEVQQKALDLVRKIGARSQEAGILSGIGTSYREQGRTDLAVQVYEQALSIAREIGDREIEGRILIGIGKTLIRQSQPEKALEPLKQALTIYRQIGVEFFEADALQTIGQAYTQLAQPTEAQTALQQALFLAKGIDARATEAEALANLGQVFAQQNQPEVAIAFYKQSINLTEQIRQGLQTLSRDQQESYTCLPDRNG